MSRPGSRRKPKVDPGPTKEEIRKVYEACGEGDYPLVKKLLRPNIDLNGTHGKVGWTMMHFAAYFGHAKIVKLLLIKGAKPDIRDLKGWGPVDYATREGHREVVHLLQDEESIQAALDAIAARKKRHEDSVVKAPEQKKKKKHFLVKPDDDAGDDLPDKTRQQVTKLLLNAWADPDLKDLCGRSPLDYARLLQPPKQDPEQREEVIESMLVAQEAIKRTRKNVGRRGSRGVAGLGGSQPGADNANRAWGARVSQAPPPLPTKGASQAEGEDEDPEDAADRAEARAEAVAGRLALERLVYDAAGDGDVEALEEAVDEERFKAERAVKGQFAVEEVSMHSSEEYVAAEDDDEDKEVDEEEEEEEEAEGRGGQPRSRNRGSSGGGGGGGFDLEEVEIAEAAKEAGDEAVRLLVNCAPYAAKRTPLHAAAHRLQPEAAKLLLSWGARVDETDYVGRTPLSAAMRSVGF